MTVGVLAQLLAAPDRDPIVAGAVAGLCGAADRLGQALRGHPEDLVS